jgi:hypothetical protein
MEMGAMAVSLAAKDIRRLITLFVKRQRMAYSVMLEHRPDILIIASANATLDEKIEAAKMGLVAQNKGTWGDDKAWEYEFHGVGCRMKHVLTGEIIEWDAPNENVFDQRWLVQYIIWLRGRSDIKGHKRIARYLRSLSEREVERRIMEQLAHMQDSGMVKSVSVRNQNKLLLM